MFQLYPRPFYARYSGEDVCRFRSVRGVDLTPLI